MGSFLILSAIRVHNVPMAVYYVTKINYKLLSASNVLMDRPCILRVCAIPAQATSHLANSAIMALNSKTFRIRD